MERGVEIGDNLGSGEMSGGGVEIGDNLGSGVRSRDRR